MPVSASLMQRLESLNLTKIGLNKCLYIIYKLGVNLNDHNRTSYVEFSPLSQTYLRLILGQYYFKTLNILKENCIVECDDIFHKGKAFCYRINPEYINDEEIVKVTFSYKAYGTPQEIKENKSYRDTFLQDFKDLTIPFDTLYEEVEAHVQGMSLTDYKYNLDAEYKGVREITVWDGNNIYNKRVSFHTAKQTAMQLDKDIIKDKDTIIIADMQDYLDQKRLYTYQSWTTVVDNLKSEDTIYAKRNKTNHRLDTNFTSMPSKLYDIILEANRMVELDATNSQPALLAMIMEKEQQGDSQYLTDTYSGVIYDAIAKKNKITRKEAKLSIFEVLFSGGKCNTEAKKQFRDTYPETWEFTSNYKTVNGKESLAILLQMEEANIFIDKLYKPLVDSGVLCFTKHDSIACKAEDLELVHKAVLEVFREVKYKGQLNIK